MSDSEYKYDVAVSLRGQDAALAERLRDALTPLNVFVFTQRQREIAGRDLVETFTEVFKRDSRLAVILYRRGWGDTEYTDLESLAIQSRGLRTRWRTPLLVQLDDTPVPLWYPEVYGYLEYERYGFEETVGVIRARAEELGAVSQPESAIEYARRMARRAEDEQERAAIMAERGVVEVGREVEELFAMLSAAFHEVREASPDLHFAYASRSQSFAVRSRRGSTTVVYEPRWSNSIDEAVLHVRLWAVMLPLPTEHRGSEHDEPTHAWQFTPVLSADRVWRWQPQPGGDPLTSRDLADSIVRKQVARAHGEQEPAQNPGAWRSVPIGAVIRR